MPSMAASTSSGWARRPRMAAASIAATVALGLLLGGCFSETYQRGYILPDGALEQIPITQPELLGIEPQRHRQRQSTLPHSPVSNGLRRDVQIVRRDRYMLPKPERKSHPEAFINRPANITPETQRTENVEVNVLRHRYRDLNITPDLIISVIDNLC